MAVATDLRIMVEDRPGGLATVGEALGGAGINIEGICGVGMGDRGVIHILVEDGAAAKAALEAAGVAVDAESEPLVSDVSSSAGTPGTMGQMARAVADAGVNLRALYIATNNRAVAVTDDNEAARRALGM
ncbi:MAG TPA: ACT domain-containing protein [Actinomycetota bacterium]|nr:ACT domain-containing protein [Actinomycetota bacterium]